MHPESPTPGGNGSRKNRHPHNLVGLSFAVTFCPFSEQENGNDHRAGTENLKFKKLTLVRLCLHCIVIGSLGV
jgi:hypothetical protein